MAKVIEGERDPQAVAAEERAAAIKAFLQKYAGRSWADLELKEKERVLVAVCVALGWIDASGKFTEP